jgi:hypothetical protein
MNDQQSKGFKLLYTVFLLAITTRTLVALYDRFHQPTSPNQKDHS